MVLYCKITGLFKIRSQNQFRLIFNIVSFILFYILNYLLTSDNYDHFIILKALSCNLLIELFDYFEQNIQVKERN